MTLFKRSRTGISALVSLSLLLALSGITIGAAGDWPQWRGPKRDNLSTEKGLLREWPKEGPPLAWKIKGIGVGFSTVSVVGGNIFTMGDQQGTTYALSLDSNGKILWSAKVGHTGGGGGYPGPRGTPTVDGDHVYVLGDEGDLVCLQAADGKEVWRTSLARDLKGQMMSGWGYAESPTVDGDNLLCTPGGAEGTVAALDKNTGKVLWRSKDLKDSASYASLVPTEISGTHQYIVLTDASVAGIGANGAVLWRAPRKGKTAVIPTPIVQDNLVFVTSGYGIGCNLFRVTKSGDKFSAQQVYANKEMQVHHGGVILLDGYVYGSSDPGYLTCMDLKTGDVKWQETGKSVGKGSLAYADGRLYLRSEGGAGTMSLVEATPAGYHELGRFNQPDRSDKNSWPHPVIAGGKMYLRDQDVLLCYDIKAK